MKDIISILILVISLSILFSCDNIDEKKLIAYYEIDKRVASDTLIENRQVFNKTADWTICLKENNTFKFIGTNKNISGTWDVEDKNRDDYYIKFQFDNKSSIGRLNGPIIYFDRPNALTDNIFKDVIFVKTTR